MKQKTFLEVMAGTDQLKLTHSQLRVLRKVMDAEEDPKQAAEQVLKSADSRNLVAATKVLQRYGYVETEPEELGHDSEPQTIMLSDQGKKAAEEYDVKNNAALQTPEEQQQSAPAAPSGEDPAPEEGGEMDAEGGDNLGMEELEGEDVGLELSSFFLDINDMAKLKG